MNIDVMFLEEIYKLLDIQIIQEFEGVIIEISWIFIRVEVVLNLFVQVFETLYEKCHYLFDKMALGIRYLISSNLTRK